MLAAACGGGDDATPSDDTRALLQAVALTTADLPPGLQLASVSVSTNQDVADASVDSEGTLAKLESRGRVLGYDWQFEPAPDAPSSLVVRGLQSTASLYKTAAGAGEALAEGIAGARNTDWKAVNPDESDVQAAELPLPSRADEGTWFRITGTDGKGNMVIDDQVAFRVDNVRGFLRVLTTFVASTDRNGYHDEVAGWVTLVANRIRDRLQHGTPAVSAAP
ncbi:MAG: hypothetical protein Q7T33_04345 [Dehalococcoidia bacterium]|nr:hypothetical protein [Dehalococcoidia bacterium]